MPVTTPLSARLVWLQVSDGVHLFTWLYRGVNGFMFGGGPAGRFVYDPIPGGVRAEAIWPGGASGVLGSSFYSNLLDLWLTNDTISLRVKLREILRVLDRADLFLPGARGAR